MKGKIILFALTVVTFMNAQNNAFNIDIKTLNNTTTTINNLTEDNDLIVISFWATWCVPCKNELDAINDLYEDWQEEADFSFLAISIDDSRTISRVRPLVNGKNWDFEILLDTNHDLKRALGVSTIPLTLIIKDGKIVYRHSGYTPGAEDFLFNEIKKHL